METPIPVEDRLAIQDLMVSYCYAVDTLSDVGAVLAVFPEDGVLDLSGIGLPVCRGHAEIAAFFEGVFRDMSHHAHYLTNFRFRDYTGNAAQATAYVIGMGRARAGHEVAVHGRYHFDAVRTPAGWKCARYSMDFTMPLPGSLMEIHGGD